MVGGRVSGNKFYVQRKLFFVTILSHSITITWVGIKQRKVAKAEIRNGEYLCNMLFISGCLVGCINKEEL